MEGVRLVKDTYVNEENGKGRPRKIWGDLMASDMRILGVSEEDAGDRIKWECRTKVADIKYLREKMKEKKKISCFLLILHWYICYPVI